MKTRMIAVVFGLLVSLNASAGWFGSNNNGWDDNDWPVWTPMYWMDEMMNEWDDDDDYYGPYGYNPYMYGQNPYMAQPYPANPYAVAPQQVLPQPAAPQVAPQAPVAK